MVQVYYVLGVVWTHLSFQANLVQLASFDETFGSILHQKKADPMSRRSGFPVCNCNHNHNIAHPTICDKYL